MPELEDSKGWGLPGGPASAVALVVAVLAAVGVAGDVLTRAIRNDPIAVPLIVSAVLLAVGIPALIITKRWLQRGGIIALLLVLIAASLYGGRSVADREIPRAAISAKTDENRVTTLTVDASGSSLRTRDDMLVQVIGLPDLADFQRLTAECEGSRLRTQFDAQGNRIPVPFDSDKGDLLAWQRYGPDKEGDVSATITLEVPAGRYQGTCVYAALRGKSSDDPRSAAAYLRLLDLGASE